MIKYGTILIGVKKLKMIKKYELLNESLKAIKEKVINLLILRGDAGFSKTYTTLKYAKDNEINYKYINTYATPLSFYKILYKNRNKDLLIFDDIQSINDPKIRSILKAACWGSENGKKLVSYYSTSKLMESNKLPESFECTPNILLIFNNDYSGFEPIIDRGVLINFEFSFKEKMEIFELFKKDAKIDDEVLEYVKENCNEATKNLSLRSLITLSDLKRKEYDFRLFAEEMLVKNDDISDLIEMDVEEWKDETGKSKSTYYRYKKKNKLESQSLTTLDKSVTTTE